MRNRNTYNSSVNPMNEAREALKDPSTRIVQWSGNTTFGPTSTLLVTKPGARLAAEVFAGQTLILTDDRGRKSATDFSVAVGLPSYDATIGKFVRGANEKLPYWSADQNPRVGSDLVIGEPLEDGSRITQVSVSADALVHMHGLHELAERFENPDRRFSLPDPTYDAEGFLREASQRITANNI